MSRMIDVTAPFDGAHIAQVPVSDAADVEHALATAYALHRNRRQWLSKPQRIAILRRAAELVTARREEIARQTLDRLAHRG